MQQYKINFSGYIGYRVLTRMAPDPDKGIFSVDNPWLPCYEAVSFRSAQQFINEAKSAKIGEIQ